jgi:hypothetical protein
MTTPTHDSHSPPTQSQNETIDTTDLQFWGHPLPFTKPANHMRLILQNPNGLDAQAHYRKLDLFARNMTAYQADVACLPETNTNWKKPRLKHEYYSTLQKHFKHHRLVTATSQATAAHSYLPGGTATIVTNEWTGRLTDTGDDPRGLGRWSYIRTKGKSEQRLLVVTAY